MKKSYIVLVLILAASSLGVAAQEISGITPSAIEKVGLSPSRLKNAHDRLRAYTSSRRLGSAVGLIARFGQIVFFESAGELGPDVPMPNDAIMRLSSITKPITAVAVLMLYERGVLQLSDPVQRYIPEFRNLKVTAATEDGKGTRLVDSNRPITIYDLLTHRAGLVASYDALDRLYSESKTALEFSLGLAALPLQFQPGSRFEYGPSYDVLVAIIEKVTGRAFNKVLRDELLSPLKMNDTYFFVPQEKKPRLAAQYRRDATGALSTFRTRGQEELPGEFYSGGGSEVHG